MERLTLLLKRTILINPKNLEETKYIIDTSSFVQSKRTYYAFDIAPSYWDFLSKLAKNKIIISIDKVFDEIARGKDNLYDWVQDELDTVFFANTDIPEILAIYKEIIIWGSSSTQFKSNAKSEFAKYENADPWLVASAVKQSITIVSQEVFDPNIQRSVPIPNVCKEFGVRHIDTFAFLRECGFRM